MTDINLLPWRELKREQDKKEFMHFIAGAVIAAMLLVVVVNRYFADKVDTQAARNQRLLSEINEFKTEIVEIKELRQLRQGLVARMLIVQELQATRGLTVHLFDELIRILPDGVFITQLERKGDRVTMSGYTESNTNISLLMRNIEASELIQQPALTEIKKLKEGKEKASSTFKLSFILKPKVKSHS